MNRSFVRWAAYAAAFATLALTSAGAFAQATITLNDPNCLSFTLQGTAPNQTLTCVQSSTPLCTISGPAAGTIGTAITLNNTCVPAATSYTWTGGNCANNTSKSCNDPGTGYANNQVVTYTVTGTNGAGAGPASAGWQVTWTNTAPVAPGGCSISGAPSGSQTAGVQVTLTVNCTTGGAPVANGYVWTGVGAAGQTTQSVGPITVNATTVFTATASNAGGVSSPAAQATVTIGGGGNGNISCAGYANTRVLNLSWSSQPLGAPVVGYSSSVGGFAGNDALVVVFTTPAKQSTGLGFIEAGEYQSHPATMYAALSTTPCDFTGAAVGQTPGGWFSVGPNSAGAGQLNTNTTYYWNLHHDSSCTGICDIIVTLQKPPGL